MIVGLSNLQVVGSVHFAPKNLANLAIVAMHWLRTCVDCFGPGAVAGLDCLGQVPLEL